ncbi:MAG: threonine/serine dehydratase [Erysipelotrichaceae bacterium]
MKKDKLTFQDVEDAYKRIQPYVYQTPLEHSIYLSKGDQQVYFKCENLQSIKAFKIRGALNKMLSMSEAEKELGVSTVSSGNHGIAVSYAANMLGIKKAVIIVPKTTPLSKIEKIKYFGGEVILMGENYDGAHTLGMKYIKDHQMTFIDSYYDDPYVYAGQGTIAIEILKQNPAIDTILVPIGGGGMLTGIAVAAKAIKPSVKVIGIQTQACPALIKALEDHVFYEEYPTEPSICDALVGGIGKLCYDMAEDYVDDYIAVKESSIEKAIVHMINSEKLVVEPAGAVGVAAVMDYLEQIDGQHIAIVISGGNIDSKLMLKLLNEYQ